MAGGRKALVQYSYRRSPDQDRAVPPRHPVVIVGAGPVGLALALDLALHGRPVVLLDDADRIGEGSRGICYAKRTLEVFDRLGVGAPLLDKGVGWQVGKVFLRDALLYRFDLLPEAGHRMPAFINLQQYHLEAELVRRCADVPGIDLRWRNKVVGVEQVGDHTLVSIMTPDGPYRLAADWLVACDGARSAVRDLLGLAFEGRVFEDRFLIADVAMSAPFPTERWFWFEPPFHDGQSALLHKQPDGVWRIDLQLGWQADPAEEMKPERVRPRLVAMLGHDDFELVWVSIYTFQCRRLRRFVHGRVIFCGDAAHQVSPFGARGANSGVQDAENLAWKLARVVDGRAGPDLLGSYEVERIAAADENIGHSTRSTDFIAPRTVAERTLRDAVLDLARVTDFAKRMVNSGRLSTATAYDESPLSTPDAEPFAGTARLGAPLPDAPVRRADGSASWLLHELGPDFTVLHVAGATPPAAVAGASLRVIGTDIVDGEGLVAARLDATPGATYVVRPDQHLAARFRTFDPGRVAAAIARAEGH